MWFVGVAAGVQVKAGAVKKPEGRVPRAVLARIFMIVAVSTAAGGIIFNATTVSMPKVFDERLSALTDSTFGIGLLVCITYLIAAMAQLLVGWWLDRHSLKGVFVAVTVMQVPLLWLAGSLTGYAMLACAVVMMFFVFGQIPINDAMIAKYTAEEWRARAYAVRYVVSFSRQRARGAADRGRVRPHRRLRAAVPDPRRARVADRRRRAGVSRRATVVAPRHRGVN